MFFVHWEEARVPRENPRIHGENMQTPHRKAGIKPGTLLLWGDGANHHTTMQPVIWVIFTKRKSQFSYVSLVSGPGGVQSCLQGLYGGEQTGRQMRAAGMSQSWRSSRDSGKGKLRCSSSSNVHMERYSRRQDRLRWVLDESWIYKTSKPNC